MKNWKKFLPAAAVAVATILMASILLSMMNARKVVIPADAVVCTGTADGFGGPLTVEVAATETQIVNVTVTQQAETDGIGSNAVAQLPGKIVEKQSLLVDGIAGCTVSSDAIKAAVANALTAGGLNPETFNVEPAADAAVEKTAETLDCDVVIIGAGGAGLTAAVMATQNNAKVIVVEKMPIVGGNSLRATGGMNAAGTQYQAELGIEDGVEDFIADTIAGGHDINDVALVTEMAEKSSEAIDWLTEIGAPLPEVAATGGTDHKFLHEPEDGSAVGPYIVQKLNENCENLGIDVMLNTTATKILTDENGAACGILADSAEHDYTINAKSVIVATGGFGANFEMLAGFNPSLADAVTTNHEGATGDGIVMAQELGADVVDMDQIQLHPTVYQATGLLVSESVRSKGGILVNTDGKRFCNEMLTRDAVSAAEFEQPGAKAWIVFDENLLNNNASTKKYVSNGITVTGNTYEELAQAMGVDPAVFAETMNTWNEEVAAGEDKEFGRTNGMDADLTTAPYYAINIAPGIHHTMGGLKIDTDTQVLNTAGEAIPGLYAAGETTGGVHGGNRLGGNAVCDFVVFGRIAGQNASNYALGK